MRNFRTFLFIEGLWLRSLTASCMSGLMVGILVFIVGFLGPALATSNQHKGSQPLHHCASHAKETALKVLLLQSDNDGRASVDEKAGVKTRPAIRTGGSKKSDVLELTGYVYKGKYRIRILYAQIPNLCARTGFEIIELTGP